MTGIAAITMCAAFTSCSHDLGFEQMTPEQVVQANYEAAFINAFGQPAPNQDWGFGQVAGTRVTRAADKSLPTNPSFSSKPSVPTFSTSVPTGTPRATKANWKDNGTFFIDNDFKNGDLENPNNQSNVTIYADGTNVTYPYGTNQNGNGTKIIVTTGSTLTLPNVSERLTVYLSPRATLKLGNNVTFAQNNAVLYMSAGSQVIGGTNLKFTSGYTVLNDGGTIQAQALNVEDGALLYNDLTGTVTATGAIYVHNTNAEIVNMGSLSGASVDVGAGALMHNVGTTTITGSTVIDNTNSKWKNEGQYTTGDFEVKAYAEQVYNNCKLTVHKADNNGEFKIYGKFVVEGGSPTGGSVVTDKLYWVNNSYFFLGTNSMLKVNGQFFTANKDTNGGIVGPTSGWAVVQAGSITHGGNEQLRMSYYNNLYVDAGTHFDQGSKDGKPYETTSQPYYYYDSTVKFKHLNQTANVSIPYSDCNPGYEGEEEDDDDDDDDDDDGYQGRIMAEDLTVKPNGAASDFDFNDVVFDWKIEGRVATIQLRAIGGTLPLTVGGQEVHAKFGVQPNVMVNTGVTTEAEPAPYEYTFPDGVDPEPINIPIFVTRSDGTFELTAEMGKVASKINVPTSTKWVKEFKDIKEAYPDFEGWVANPTATWTSNYNSALLYNPL